jgi:uncharacterized membrane protein YvbJ
MSFGALGAKAASVRYQKPTKRCDRCDLHYPEDEEKCIHCGDISDNELLQFLEKIEDEKISARNLGSLFFYIAILITFGMVILFL